MLESILEKTEGIAKENNLTMEQMEELGIKNLEQVQNKFLDTNLGKAINGGIDIGLRIILPECLEDEIINIKDSLITEGFSAAASTAVEEASNLGKSLLGIITGKFENISQVEKAIEKGGLMDTISNIVDIGLEWAKNNKYIKASTAKTIKSSKKIVVNSIKDNVDNLFENQVENIDKINGYIDKWQKYYEENNLQNMEYQYEKIQEYLPKVIPLEETIKKAKVVENLHELIKNNKKEDRFNLSEEEKELAQMLVN